MAETGTPKPVVPTPGGRATVNRRRRKRRPGRPSLLTTATEEKFLSALRGGSHRREACEYAGLVYGTVDHWIQRGRGHVKGRPATPEYVNFADAVKEAEATVSVIAAGQILAAGRTDWRAAKYLLNVKHPQEWPRLPDSDITVMPGEQPMLGSGPAYIDQRSITIAIPADQLPEYARRLIAARRAAAEPEVDDLEPEEHQSRVVTNDSLARLRVDSTED